jgi:gamma-glutamylcyclotransferase (GGCT)/AIG2-like uncharacterized protein YtfP
MLAEYLFVYGTLKRDIKESRSELLVPHCEFFAYASAPGKLYLFEDHSFIYPGFVFEERSEENSENWVQGELYVITDKDKLFEILDEYEACSAKDPKPHQYRKQQIMVKSNVAFEYQAWTYIYNWPTTGLKHIESGRFD